MTRPLLMIPGPIELSPAVQAAVDGPPPSHVAPAVIQAFGDGLRRMRTVWGATDDSAPFAVAGSGTLAMDAAVANLVAPGDRALVVHTGYFSARMADMLRRRGAVVDVLAAEPGHAPDAEALTARLEATPADLVFITHVDTSTGVLVDLPGLAAAVRATDALLIVDGVCATGAERTDMAALGADVVLTASQKAIGLPPGLALWVASPRALARRDALTAPVPMFLDWQVWRPILTAYEEGRPSYFATPATPLIRALPVALDEIADVDAVHARHVDAARRLRAAWTALDLRLLPGDGLAAHTLSALWIPEGHDATLPAKVAAHGVIIAGGLLPELRSRYVRVGHMGYSTTRPDHLARTVEAIAHALGRDPRPALDALGG